MSGARVLLRNRPFRLLWTGHTIASFGDAATSLALMLTAYRLTGSAAAVAGVAIALALPQLLVGLPAGVLVDRWNRRRVLILSDLLRATLVLGFLAVTSADTLWLLYALAFAQAAVGTFFNPAKGALLPELVPADQLLPANSLSELSRVVAGVAGVAVAGATGGLGAVFVLCSATFLVSAALVSRLPGTAAAASGALREGVRAELVSGLRLVFGSRMLLGVTMAATVLMFGVGAVNVLLVPFVLDGLDASEAWFGAMRGAQVASMVLAGALLALLAARLRPPTLVSVGLVGVGLVVAAMAASTRAWHLLVLLFAVGWFITPVQASISTILQAEVPAGSRGRAHASFAAVVAGASLASMALAGAAAEAVGVRLVFLASGAVAIAAGLASAVAFRSCSQPDPARKEQAWPLTEIAPGEQMPPVATR